MNRTVSEIKKNTFRQNMKTALRTLLLLVILFSCKDNSTEPGSPWIPDPVPPLDEYPTWSPDGTKILYYHRGIIEISEKHYWGYDYSTDINQIGLWMVNSDGTNPHLLINKTGIIADWSPDGNWIVFETGGQIYKTPVSGDSLVMSQVVQLTTEGRNFFPAWSPDGEWIAFDSNVIEPYSIWKMYSDGSDKTQLRVSEFEGDGRSPHWSPDTKRIVFQSYYNREPELFIMNSDGSSVFMLTENTIYERYPKWSPDCMSIVFDGHDNSGSYIYVMNLNTGNSKRIAEGIHPDWSPDGAKIIYVKGSLDDPKNNTLWIMNRDGSGHKQLTFYHQQ